MPLPSRRTRIGLLAGVATLAIAAPAGAAAVPAFNATTGELTITYTGTDNVILGTTGANVSLNGADTGVAAANVRTIVTTETPAGGDNTIDLSAVTAAAFPNLTGTTLTAADGVDTVIGSQLNDRIVPGRGNDIMRGEGGADSLVWNPGEGDDEMDGGNGVDTVESNGGGGDENFKASPLPNGGFRFERVSPAPFILTTVNAELLLNNMNGGNDTMVADNGLNGLVLPTINGGDGNDTVTGTDANDTVNGGAGNDTITGFRGDDTVNGDDGDDTMIWNNGDGSDRNEGGAGNDTSVINGAAAGDVFHVVPNAGRVTAGRLNLGPIFVNMGTVETLDLNGQAGDDRVEIEDGIGTTMKIDVDGGDGNDTFETRNNSADTVKGGAGTDSAIADATDTISEVETVDVPDTTAPAVVVRTNTSDQSRGKAPIRLECPAGESSCKGTVRIIRNGRTVGSAKINLTGGQVKTYRVSLNAATRTRLRNDSNGRIGATVRVTATDAAGNEGTTTKQIVLKR